MSRIEEALEKAAQKRNQTAPQPRSVRQERAVMLTEPALPKTVIDANACFI